MGAREIFTLAAGLAFMSSAAIAQSSVTPYKNNERIYMSYLLGDSAGMDKKNPGNNLSSKWLKTVQEVCCPGGYPWYRNSTNTCYGSYEDCHDTDGGGWSCRQVNAC